MKEKIINYINDRDMDGLKNMLAASEEMEILHAYYDLSPEEQVIVFRMLTKDAALSIFEELDTTCQRNLLGSFKNGRAKELVNEMSPDDRVRLLDELPASVAKMLLESLSPEERDSTSILMGYEPETAGRIMTTEFISLNRSMTVEQALEKVSEQAEEKETVYTLFVTDETKKLEGVLTLKGLLIAKGLSGTTIAKTDGNTIVGDIMSKNAIRVSTDTDQEEVARILQELDLLAIPVVDKEQRIVGIVTIDDALDILEEETTEDIFDQAGLVDVKGSEADRSEVLVNGNLWRIWLVRLPFLLATMVIGIFSGLVIEGFEETLESIAAVAIFIPLIMGMGGNVGTQSSTVFARGVVLGHIQLKNFFRHFIKEIGVGMSIGLLLGTISGIVASIWLGIPMLGVAVGLAMLITMTVAAFLGFLVPYVLIKCNVDQAAGSAPIITSLKDFVALVVYFVCVSLFLGNML